MKILSDFIEKLYLRNPDNLIYVDEMTGVKTRSYYDNVIKHKYQAEEVFIAFVDVNNLKKINDELGHHEGSEFIRKTAHQLSLLNVKEVCRIGGDEFIIIADKDFDRKSLNSVERISYGYIVKTKEQTVSEAVKIADEYMYKRKNTVHKREANKNHKKEGHRKK